MSKPITQGSSYNNKYFSQSFHPKESKKEQFYIYQTPYRKFQHQKSYKPTSQHLKSNFSVHSSMIVEQSESETPKDKPNMKIQGQYPSISGNNYLKKAYYKTLQTQADQIIEQYQKSKPCQNTYSSQKNEFLNLNQSLDNNSDKSQMRIYRLQSQLKKKSEKIVQLQHQLVELKNKNVNNQIDKQQLLRLMDSNQRLEIENQKLKHNLAMAIGQKNQILLRNKSMGNFSTNTHLKMEVQELHVMVNQLKNTIQNCPSCYSLKREKQQLIQGYQTLEKLYNNLRLQTQHKQDYLLRDITVKIQQNQNMKRQNMHLREQTLEKKRYLKRRRQNREGSRVSQSIAKRCRTLTECY